MPAKNSDISIMNVLFLFTASNTHEKILAVLENSATALGPALGTSSIHFMETSTLLLFSISTYTSDYL